MGKMVPVLNFMEKTRDTHYLKNYTLNYTNTVGKEKIYEMVSHYDYESIDEIGQKAAGVCILGYKEDKLLLLKEFRLGINDFIYNLPAGRIDSGEDVESSARRELYEETGMSITKMIACLPPSFAAPDLSDASAWLMLCELEEHAGDNEWIQPGLYNREEVKKLLEEDTFSGRAQVAAWFFAQGMRPSAS